MYAIKDIFRNINTQPHKGLFFLITIIFLFNNFLMPHGLSMCFILSPVFLYLIYKNKSIPKAYILVVLLFFFYLSVHFTKGIESHLNYLKTSLLLASAWILLSTMYFYFRKINLAQLFKLLSMVNFICFLASVLFLSHDKLKTIFWSLQPISNGIPAIPRLQMFTPEPSHYALLLIPLVFYFTIHIVINGLSKEILSYWFMSMIPFVASLSFGALFIFAFTLFILGLVFPKKLFFSKKNLKTTIIVGFMGLICITILHQKIPNNPISVRIERIFVGEDTSVNGRTSESFSLAKDVAKDKSYWFGAGPGQSKIIAKKYYFKNLSYRSEMPTTIRFSNVSATTLAAYGLFGLFLRILLLLFIFTKFKIYKNIYGTSIFIFMFIFQFMASYMINLSELSLWTIALLSYYKNEFNWANAD